MCEKTDGFGFWKRWFARAVPRWTAIDADLDASIGNELECEGKFKHYRQDYNSTVGKSGGLDSGRGNKKRQSESECVELERTRVVYLLQASASVSSE
ncbi:hypothetical protein EVAR_2580_1 [Eumeta japonica]|uniref:Uncharacterized protein n=1 Tax=Eumeta variegata TaxID=151549 RepID=A0A4C1SM87_EUMVA|nr:hypothetical protein EVAR_2580_1 [Eumeta japonica]